MESPSRALALSSPLPLPRRSISDLSNMPEFEFEFEFWQNSNSNSGPISTPLHSADELFSDGFLLPLHSLETKRSEPEAEPVSSEPSALITSEVSSNGNPILNASKRWRELFKRSEKKMTGDSNSSGNNINDLEGNKHERVEKKTEKNSRKNKPGSTSAELNINLWPFSRSRSAGNNSTRSNKSVQLNRKVSSAPCSRSNSSGESKSSRRSWPSSPGRAGVHLGRASPVWHVKKAGPGNRALLGGGMGNGSVSKINVPACIGHRQYSGCRNGENSAVVGGGGKGGGSGTGNGNLFGFRGLFSKKSNTVLTV